MLALLLIACRCPSFEELRVVDPDDETGEAFTEAVHEAIDDFAAWTGREGVCVGEVVLQDELLPDVHATMPPVRNTQGGLRVRTGIGAQDPYYNTMRGLCEALDEAEDLSWPNRELFPPTVEGGGETRHDVARRFGLACAEGPSFLFGASVALDEGCDTADLDEQARFLAEVVWTEHTAQTLGPRRAMRVERVPLPAPLGELAEHELMSASAGQDLFLLAAAPGGPVQLWRIHGESGQILHEMVLDEEGEITEWALVTSLDDEGPLVVQVLLPRLGPLRTRAWRYNLSQDTLSAVQFPTLLDSWALRGQVSGDQAFVWAWPLDGPSDRANQFIRVDLNTGDWVPFLQHTFKPHNLVAAPQGLWGSRLTDTYTDDVFLLDPQTARVQVWPGVRSAEPLPVLPDADGVLWTIMGLWSGMGLLYNTHDPALGDWHAAQNPCGDQQVHPTRRGEVIDGVPSFLVWTETGLEMVRVLGEE